LMWHIGRKGARMAFYDGDINGGKGREWLDAMECS